MELDQDAIKKYGWHLKVVGAYVQNPVPSIVGLDDNTVIGSNDAASLYPISGAHQNLGFDTLRDRIYDINIVKQILGLIETVYAKKGQTPGIIDQAVSGFTGAIRNSLTNYFQRGKSKGLNKKEAMAFTTEYYPILLRRLLSYRGKLEDIYSPIDDRTYYLLKSCLYPLLETIFWLNPQNRGYNQTAVDYVLFNNDYMESQREYYVFREINSVRTQFKKVTFQEGVDLFKSRVVNPYGVLFDLHDTNLAYDVEITLASLVERSEYKDQMLVLEAIESRFSDLSATSLKYLSYRVGENTFCLTRTEANQILDDINDPENREWRLAALTKVGFSQDDEKVLPYITLRVAQLNIIQLGIKVSMNSGYGIFAMPTWVYSNALIGNGFTCAGKIFGIKLFQNVSVNILEERKRQFELNKKQGI